MKKKMMLLMLTLSIVTGMIIGCSQDTSDPDSEEYEGNGDNGENGEGAASADLVLWVAGNSEQIQNTFGSIVDDFNEQHDHIDVKVQFEPWEELDQKLSTSLAGGVGPDVFMHGAAAAADFATRDQIESLDQFFDHWEEADDFVQAYVESGSVQGERYVVPIQGANRMMFYRTDMFEEAGVSVPETMEELIEISENFVVRDGSRYERAPTVLPIEGNDLQQVWSMFLFSNNGEYFNEDYTEATLYSPEAIEAVELYTSFFEKELTPISGVGGQGDQHPLGTGEVAFTFDGVWAIEQIMNYTPDAYDLIDVAVPPRGKGEPVTHVGSSGFFMNASTDHKDEAWELMAFLGSKENIEKVSEELKFLPVRESTIHADFVQEDRLFAKFVELASETEGRANPNIPKWTTIRDIVASNVESAIYGQKTAEEAMKDAEEAINQELQE